MGKTGKPRQLYITDLQAMKDRGEPIVLAAPWDYTSTLMAEAAGADVVVVGGGTTAMMMGGRPHALTATMEDVLSLTRMVAPAVRRAVFYVSLPYGSFHVSNAQAVENALQLVKAGAHCIKAQTPGALIDRAKAIIDAGIPFVGHVGLLPHLIYKRGGFRAFGRSLEEAVELYSECVELERAGAVAIEMEAVPAPVAEGIAKRLRIPVFGIGAGPGTDGQFIVLVDALGLTEQPATRFAKRYANLWPTCAEALSRAVTDIRDGSFPEDRHCFAIDTDEMRKFKDYLARGSVQE